MTTALTRMRHKGSSDRAVLDALLDEIHIGHFAFVVDGKPVVLPTAIARDGDVVLAHGSTGSPWLRALAGGVQTCLAVTALDALLVARSAFESSMHYRSAVIFGQCSLVSDLDEKRRSMDVLTEALIPGRTAEIRSMTAKEVAATVVVALPIETWSLKLSNGWPEDGDDDVAGPAWAGIVPIIRSHGAVVPALDLRPGIDLPPSVSRLLDPSAEAGSSDR